MTNNKENVGIGSLTLQTNQITVKHRNIGGPGKLESKVLASTVRDLKRKVLDRLAANPTPTGSPYVPTEVNITIQDITDPKDPGVNFLDDLGDANPLDPKRLYEATEVHQTVPQDLYRTILLEEMHQAVRCQPAGERHWSNVAPLKCAAMTKDESQFPCCSSDPLKGLTFKGISLMGIADEPPSNLSDPLSHIKDDEGIGYTSMAASALTCKYNPQDEYGILHCDTFCTNELGVPHFFTPCRSQVEYVKEKSKKTKKERKEKGLAMKRIIYLRYMLPKGTDLTPLGMAVVYDNNGLEHHWTLVRMKEHDLKNNWWHYIPETYTLFPPQARSHNLSIDDAVDTFLAPSTSPAEEPVTIAAMVGKVVSICFPKVASKFVFHDIKINAAAEPVPPPRNHDDPTSADTLYKAVLVLFYLGSCEFADLAIAEFADSGYPLDDNMGTLCRQVLLQEMKGVTPDSFDGLDIPVELDKEEEETYFDLLLGGIAVLEKLQPLETLQPVIYPPTPISRAENHATKTPSSAAPGGYETDPPPTTSESTSASTGNSTERHGDVRPKSSDETETDSGTPSTGLSLGAADAY